jgi:glycosyltransferase involved in cell wall biosynthesis
MTASRRVSVVIPTYNRKDSVLRTLSSLCQQTLPADEYEVIVVDDGSSYDTAEITTNPFPFRLEYLRQANQGATIARNNGARRSQGEVLVFIDDDVTISEQALAALADACTRETAVLTMGTLISRTNGAPSPFTQDAVTLANQRVMNMNGRSQDQFVHFSECNTQLLSIKRDDFFALGMLQDPTGGWPNWDDVDFGYRAHLAGFRLLQSAKAVGEHWDYSIEALDKASHRWWRASKSAVRLFQVHPGLQPHIPMLHDKTPISLKEDSPAMIGRKLLRRLVASKLLLWSMEKGVQLLERSYPSPALLRPLYRWIQGSYMLRGYRAGLREAAHV